MGLDDHEQVEVRSRANVRTWLSANHDRDEGVWLVTWTERTDHWLPLAGRPPGGRPWSGSP